MISRDEPNGRLTHFVEPLQCFVAWEDKAYNLNVIAGKLRLAGTSRMKRLNILFMFESPKAQIKGVLLIFATDDGDMGVDDKFGGLKPNLSGSAKRTDTRRVNEQVVFLQPLLCYLFRRVKPPVFQKHEVIADAGLA